MKKQLSKGRPCEMFDCGGRFCRSQIVAALSIWLC
jgi:hypothetical protein